MQRQNQGLLTLNKANLRQPPAKYSRAVDHLLLVILLVTSKVRKRISPFALNATTPAHKLLPQQHKNQKHVQEKTHFVCTQCNLPCAQAAHLRRHMLSHSEATLFSWPHCNYSRTKPINFKTHVLTHSRENLWFAPSFTTKLVPKLGTLRNTWSDIQDKRRQTFRVHAPLSVLPTSTFLVLNWDVSVTIHFMHAWMSTFLSHVMPTR